MSGVTANEYTSGLRMVTTGGMIRFGRVGPATTKRAPNTGQAVSPSQLTSSNTWENHHFDPDVQHVPKIVQFLGYNPFAPPPTSFPARLKAARIGGGLTRRQLASKIGIHPATVAKWERGEAQPVVDSRKRLQTKLGLPLNEEEGSER